MSRRAYWPPSATVAADSAPNGAAPQAAHVPPTGAPSPTVPAGRGTPEVATAGEIRARGATVAALGAALARVADLHGQLAQAHRDLVEVLKNELAVTGERALMCPVKPARLLTVDDLADRLQLDARTVRRMRTRGQLPPAIDLHSVLRWDEATIDAWIEGRRER